MSTAATRPSQRALGCQRRGVGSGVGGEQDGEYKEHDYAAGIDRDLHAAQKFIVEHKVYHCGAEEREEQVGGGAQDFAGGDGQHRAYHDDGDYHRVED